MITARNIYQRRRLTARPDNTSEKEKAAAGLQPLHLVDEKDGLIYVPKSYNPGNPAALAVMMHGA